MSYLFVNRGYVYAYLSEAICFPTVTQRGEVGSTPRILLTVSHRGQIRGSRDKMHTSFADASARLCFLWSACSSIASEGHWDHLVVGVSFQVSYQT